MSRIMAEVSLYVNVWDKVALIEAARRRYLEDSPDAPDVLDVLPDDDIPAALRMLLDIGALPPGCDVIDSDVESCEFGK